MSFLVFHRNLFHLWILLLESLRSSTGPQSKSMTLGGILRSFSLMQMEFPSEGKVKLQTLSKLNPLFETFLTVSSLHFRYELHCPFENVEKDIAELLWWTLLNLSPVAEWWSLSKCICAPELDLMGRGACLRASVHSLWEQVPFSHWRGFYVAFHIFLKWDGVCCTKYKMWIKYFKTILNWLWLIYIIVRSKGHFSVTSQWGKKYLNYRWHWELLLWT